MVFHHIRRRFRKSEGSLISASSLFNLAVVDLICLKHKILICAKSKRNHEICQRGQSLDTKVAQIGKPFRYNVARLVKYAMPQEKLNSLI